MHDDFCMRYNNELYDGKYYEWHQFKSDDSRDDVCKVVCRPKVVGYYLAPRIETVADDGIRCGRSNNSDKVCLAGSCEV